MLEPQTTLKALKAFVFHGKEAPHTTEEPLIEAPQTTEAPHTTEDPQTTDVDATLLLPCTSETEPLEDCLLYTSTYHVVAGRLSAADLKKQIKDGHGTAELKTVEGGKLWASMDGNHIMLKDEKGGTAMVTLSLIHI